MCGTHVSSLTGLGPVLDPIIVHRRSSLFGHVARFSEDTCAHQATLIYHSVAFQTRLGGDFQAALKTGDLTNSAGTTVHLLTS